MVYSENAMCAILLCSYLGIKSDDSVKPLSLGEWNTLLEKLAEVKEEPGAVLQNDSSWAEKVNCPKELIERIRGLILRGGNVALELDDLGRKGIFVVTQFDENYPILLKRKLKKKMPPILYYAGNIDLAKKIGIAVAGSRNVDEDGIAFTRRLVEKASKEKLVIYSGGAKGVDTVAEETAIKSGSAVISFIADSLLSKIKKKQVTADIISGNLLLFSDVKPDAGFSAARAMNRNKYIYASSYGAFVVSADYNKGGTWNGAIESLHNGFAKTLVWNNQSYAGNQKLIQKGCIPFDITEESIYQAITKKEETYEQLDLFHADTVRNGTEENQKPAENGVRENDVYDVIKEYIVAHLENGMRVEDASKNLNVVERQMEIWLKRLCEDKLIRLDKGVYRKA